MKIKSVKSINQLQSLPVRQAGVIQTTHDIIKAHGGDLSINSNPKGSIFTITIPSNS